MRHDDGAKVTGGRRTLTAAQTVAVGVLLCAAFLFGIARWSDVAARSAADGGTAWSGTKSGITKDLSGVSCADAGRCVAVGGGGTIVRSADDGATWSGTASGTTALLYSVSCTGAGPCVAVGGGGTILHSADGGATWASASSGTAETLYGVSCLGTGLCVAVGDHDAIVRSADNGATWGRRASSITGTLRGVSCAAASPCVAVGDDGSVVHSADGGATWGSDTSSTVDVSFTDGVYLHGVSCTDAKLCVAVGDHSTLLRTDDGVTWEGRITLTLGTDSGLRGVSCVGSAGTGRCVAVGMGGAILRDTDGGATWRGEASGSGADLLGVSCPDAGLCVAVGTHGTILRSTGGASPLATAVASATAGTATALPTAGTRAGTATQTTVVTAFAYNDPRALALDSHGTIYVADYGNKRVIAVSPDSSQIKIIASGLKHPTSLAVDGHGTVYIDDAGVGIIAVAANGHRPLMGTNLDSAVAVALGPDGSLYAALWPSGITRIQPNGTQTMLHVDSSSAGNGLSVSLAIDGHGTLYRADGRELKRIAPDGRSTFVHTPLTSPRWVAVGPDDAVYVAGTQHGADAHGASLIVRIAKDGRQTVLGSGPNLPLGLAVDRSGAAYCIDGVSRHLLRIQPDGHTETVGPLAGTPAALALDRQGNVYVGDYTNYGNPVGLVGARANGTRILKIWPDGRQTTVVMGGIAYPSALAVDRAGTLYVLDSTDKVLKVDAGATRPQAIPGLIRPAGIAADGQGVLYVVDVDDARYLNPVLVKIHPDGRRETTKLAGMDGKGLSPLAISSNGTVYVGNGRRLLVIAVGGQQQMLASPLKDDTINALAVGSNGTLYVVGKNAVQALAVPSSGQPRFFGSGLYKVGAIAVDAYGALYVADTGNGRIVRMQPPV